MKTIIEVTTTTATKETWSHSFEAMIPPVSLNTALSVAGFFFAATCLRWLVKSRRKNEFDAESVHD